MNIVVAGDSAFSWALVDQIKGQIEGRLYFVLPDSEQALEASLVGDVVAVRGDITDAETLDELELASCHSFVAGSRQDEDNVLSALYAKNKGAKHVRARIQQPKLIPLLTSLGITPIQTSHTAAASIAIDILKPAVSELVSLTQGQFVLEEINAREFPELVGCRLGNLQGEYLHIIAVAQGGCTLLSYNVRIEPDAKLIIICDKSIRHRLRQELRKVAAQASARLDSG
jgi:Trk K+ transport system NAD-binding subunit